MLADELLKKSMVRLAASRGNQELVREIRDYLAEFGQPVDDIRRTVGPLLTIQDLDEEEYRIYDLLCRTRARFVLGSVARQRADKLVEVFMKDPVVRGETTIHFRRIRADEILEYFVRPKYYELMMSWIGN